MSMRSKTLLVTLLLITATVASYGQQFAGKFLKLFTVCSYLRVCLTNWDGIVTDSLCVVSA